MAVSFEELHAAISCLKSSDYLEFRQHWCGQHDQPPTLIRYANEVLPKGDDDKLRNLLEELQDDDDETWIKRAASLTSGAAHTLLDASLQQQLANLLQAFIATVALAVQYVSDQKVLSDSGRGKFRDAIRFWKAAWSLSDVPVSTRDMFQKTHVSHDSSTTGRLLNEGLNATEGSVVAIDVCTFLILRRVLTYIFGESLSNDTQFSNQLKILLVRGCNTGYEGQMRSFECQRTAETGYGFYPDPLAFGVMLLDEDMIRSLRVAWFVTDQSLRNGTEVAVDAATPNAVLRLDASFEPEDLVLSGESAGALLACGLYAGARRIKLLHDVSISCRLGVTETAASKLIEIPLERVENLQEKLQEAGKSIHEIRRVVVLKTQHDKELRNKNFAVSLGKAETLEEAFKQLIGDPAKTSILRMWCEKQLGDWESITSDPNHVDLIPHLMEPTFSVLGDGVIPVDRMGQIASHTVDRVIANPYVRVGDEGDQHLANFLTSATHLCISDDSGAGKSVASRRLTAFVSSPMGHETLFHGHPCLAIRFEEFHDDWPVNLRATLETAVRPFVERWNTMQDATRHESPHGVVSWALDNGRCWIALDGLDQVEDRDRLRSIREFLRNDGKNSRVLLTGRHFVVARSGLSEQSSLLDACNWRFARVNPFGIKDQYRYLEPLLPEEHRGIDIPSGQAGRMSTDLSDRLRQALATRLPDYPLIADLLSIPIVLRIVRDLMTERPEVRFSTRGELYMKATRMTIVRAGNKIPEKLIWHPDKDVELVERMSGAVAFQMAADLNLKHSVDTLEGVRALRLAAAKRCGLLDFSDRDWDLFISVSVCTNRAMLAATLDRQVSFRHRSFMEFYAGWHLIRNMQMNWFRAIGPAENPDCICCGEAAVKENINSPTWYWIWRFASEIPSELWDERVALASFSEVFRLPQTGLRPCELMYRVLPFLEPGDETYPIYNYNFSRKKLPYSDVVLREFRSPSKKLLTRINAMTKKYGRRPALGTAGYRRWWSKWRKLRGSVRSHVLLQIKPKEHHSLLLATPVTQIQYAAFDEKFSRDSKVEKVVARIGADPQKMTGDLKPVHSVTFYESFVFAKWLGPEYSLPTVDQWMMACSSEAGLESPFAFGDRLTGDDANFDDRTGSVLGRSGYRSSVTEVGEYPCQSNGFVDMHGNVAEWCRWNSSVTEECMMPLKGGSWNGYSEDCEILADRREKPAVRSPLHGFRISRTHDCTTENGANSPTNQFILMVRSLLTGLLSLLRGASPR